MHKQNSLNRLRLLIKKTVVETIKEAADETPTAPKSLNSFRSMIANAAEKAGGSKMLVGYLSEDPEDHLYDAWSNYEQEIRGLNKKEMWNTFLNWVDEGTYEAAYAYLDTASEQEKYFNPYDLAKQVVQVLNNQK